MGKHSNVPAFFMCPQYIVDEVAFALSREEFLVLMFAVRHILGWQDKLETRQAYISLSVFSKGRTTKKGTVLHGTGLGEPALRKALASLVSLGLLIRVGSPTEKGQLWELPVEYDTDLLIPRAQEKALLNQKRTEKARANQPQKAKRGDVAHQVVMSHIGGDVAHQGGGDVAHQGGGDVAHQTYIDTPHTQEIEILASHDAGASTRLYPCSSKDIAALITAWWNWLPVDLRPTQRGRVVESSKHYANKTNREYAQVLIERGYTPGDVIEWWQSTRTAMKAQPTRAYSKMSSMPFVWVMSQVEPFAANKRHQTLYTNDVPRCLPWKADEGINGNVQVEAMLLWQEGKREAAQGLGFCVDVPGRIWTAQEYELLKAGKPLLEDLENDDD